MQIPSFDGSLPAGEPSELTKRIATAAVGGSAMILLVALGGWLGICLLATILSLAMINEFAGMTLSLPDRSEKRYALLFSAWFAGLGNFIFPASEFALLTICFLLLFGYYLFAAEACSEEDLGTHFKELMASFFGLLYLVFLPLYLTRIQASLDGVRWTLVFFLIVWAGDSAAYFVGKKYGRRKLYPRVSPKKTLEGAAGGIGGGIVAAVVFKAAFFHAMPWLATAVVPVLVGASAQVGDLCESLLKRAFGKKDSGSFLPGHGGFLDRFDGVVFSLPVMYVCIRLFGAGG